MKGKFLAMSEVYKTMFTLAPKPYGWGKHKDESPSTYFFISEFLNISDRLPDPVQLGACIAELHKESVSPTGKFGFFVSTYDGDQIQVIAWDSSWPSFFGKLLSGVLDLNSKMNGHWEELENILHQTIIHVILRWLGALEADGGKIKPCLILGDLWESNIGTDTQTDSIYLSDASAYYALNEMEIGIWRVDHHYMKAKAEAYRRQYSRYYEPSEPVDGYNDRNRLYSTKTTLINSAAFPGTSVRLTSVNR